MEVAGIWSEERRYATWANLPVDGFDGFSGLTGGPSETCTASIIGRPDAVDATLPVSVVAGEGRVLMPGLIDMQWHAILVRPTPAAAMTDHLGYTNLLAGDEATDPLS